MDCNREFAKVLAHEFGHGAYRLLNKAEAYFYPADPKNKGHDQGNPDGVAADKASTQFEKNYKAAKKALQEENKKKKKKNLNGQDEEE